MFKNNELHNHVKNNWVTEQNFENFILVFESLDVEAEDLLSGPPMKNTLLIVLLSKQWCKRQFREIRFMGKIVSVGTFICNVYCPLWV